MESLFFVRFKEITDGSVCVYLRLNKKVVFAMLKHIVFNISANRITINFCLFCIYFILPSAMAETLTFTATYSDTFTQSETEDQIRVISQTRARRMLYDAVEQTIQNADFYKQSLPVENLSSTLAFSVMTTETKSLSLKKTSNGHKVFQELIGNLDIGTLEGDLNNFVKNRFLFENALANRELELEQLGVLEALEKKFRSVQQPKKQYNLVPEKELLASKRQRVVNRLAAISLNDTVITTLFRNIFLDPGEMIKRLNQAVALDDRNEWLYLHRGSVFSRLKDIIFASADFERAVLLNPYLLFPYEFMGDVLYKAGKTEKAIQSYTKALDLDMQYEPTLLKRGKAYRKIGQYNWAVRDFSRVVGIDSKNSVGYFERGETRYASGDYIEADIDFGMAIALNPLDGVAFEKRGRSRMAMGLSDGACDDLRKACELGVCDLLDATAKDHACVSLNPSIAGEWASICYEQILLGRWNEAIKAATLSIYYNPETVNSYINRAWAYAEIEDFENAIEDCSRALKLDPDNAMAHNNCGLVFEKKGDKRLAGKNYFKACELGLETGCRNYLAVEKQSQPEESRVDRLLRQSTQKHRDKNWDAVVHLTSLVIQKDPDNYQAYTDRAAAFTQTGELEEALTDSSVAIRISPSFGLAYNIRGYTLEHMGKTEEALVDYYVGCIFGFDLACQNRNRLEHIINKK